MLLLLFLLNPLQKAKLIYLCYVMYFKTDLHFSNWTLGALVLSKLFVRLV